MLSNVPNTDGVEHHLPVGWDWRHRQRRRRAPQVGRQGNELSLAKTSSDSP